MIQVGDNSAEISVFLNGYLNSFLLMIGECGWHLGMRDSYV